MPNATVTLFAGDRQGVRQLGRATTDANGSFQLRPGRYAGSVLYVEAVPSGDRALRLRSVVGVGPGGGVPQRSESAVTVNELTTVATGYALAQFTDQRGISGPSPGLENAAATSYNLADPATGKPGKVVTDQNNGDKNDTLATLGTLADLVSLCAPGADTGRCQDMLHQAASPRGSTPADTAQAVSGLAHNPRRATGPLYALAGQAHTYTPTLTAAPTAWVLALHYTAPQVYAPGRIAVDAKGNVWAANNWLPGTRNPSPYVTVQDPVGNPTLNSPISGGGMKAGAWGIAIDHEGYVWVPSYAGDAMSKYSSSGEPLSPSQGFSNGDLNHPQGTAVDQKGNVWIADFYGLKGNRGKGNVVVYPHGDPSKAITITGGGLDHPFSLQIDGYGRAWVSNARLNGAKLMDTRPLTGHAGGSVTVIGPDFKPTSFSPIKDTSLDWPLALAVDSRNNVWVPDFLSNSVTEIGPAGKVTGAYKLPTTIAPWSVAVDGSDRVWVAGFGAPSVSVLCGVNTGACPPGSSTGSVLSPPDGYRSNSIQHLTAVQLDQSGNVWLANNWSKLAPPTGGTGLVELVGAATPVCAPLQPLPARPASTGPATCALQTSTQPR
ncbi:NHL repeat-containing protein [Streptomyces fodineus]|uniref:NHL repeat-containing protein n=1 Tax=Streptomyces fodineus TaxID=1904616 RepID=UPI001D03CEA6|nr:NHL repeat-containing protein [Streptomyces fodineus]